MFGSEDCENDNKQFVRVHVKLGKWETHSYHSQNAVKKVKK
jgi:hypothetical protein